jgi:MoaA/NifB/PqqE/SkfB family radical SAM enzyme
LVTVEQANAHFGGSMKMATVFLTRDCNMACPYCYAREADSWPGGPGDGEWHKEWSLKRDSDARGRLWDSLAGAGYKIAIGGGEPLMHPELMAKVAGEAISRGMAVSLLTNGSLLDHRMLWTIKQTGIRWVQVSADTVEDFRRIAPHLERGSALGLQMAVGTVFLPQRLPGVKEMYRILSRSGAVGWRILRYTPLSRHGPAAPAPTNIQWIGSLCALEAELLPEQDGVQVRYEPSIVPLEWMQATPPDRRPDICGGRQARRLFLYPDGEIYACGLPRRSGIKLGNWKTNPQDIETRLNHVPVDSSPIPAYPMAYCREICKGGCLQMRTGSSCDSRCEPENRLVPVCCFEKLILINGKHLQGPVLTPSQLYRGVAATK